MRCGVNVVRKAVSASVFGNGDSDDCDSEQCEGAARWYGASAGSLRPRSPLPECVWLQLGGKGPGKALVSVSKAAYYKGTVIGFLGSFVASHDELDLLQAA